MSNKFCIKKNFFVFLVLIILVGVYFVFSNKLSKDKKSLSTSAALRKQTTPPTTPVLKKLSHNPQIRKGVYLTDNFVNTVRETLRIGDNFDNANKVIREVELSVRQYMDKLSCAQSGVTIDYQDLSAETVTLNDSSTQVTMAISDPGVIKINVVYVSNALEKSTDAVKEFKRIVYHEMTHACKPDYATSFTQEFTLFPGTESESKAYAMHGLSILVNKDGRETKFMSIEEGVAEALADYLYADYSVTDPSYFQVGALTKSFIIYEWQSGNNQGTDLAIYQKVAKFVQTNDLIGYVREFLGQKTTVTYNDINQVATWYGQARNKSRSIDEINAEILQYIENNP